MKTNLRLAAFLSVGLLGILLPPPATADLPEYEEGRWAPLRPSLAGTPRAWESGMPAGTATSVNLRNGNLLTVLPLVSWSGRGPALTVGLYHNSAAVDSESSSGAEFDLGPGWTIAYGGFIINSGAEATVVDDDGTRTTYTWDGMSYVPPPGIYATLEKTITDGWKLTYKDQTYREYDSGGRLVKVWDASGNWLVVDRDPDEHDRIKGIQDASGRELDFAFDGPAPQGRLVTITDPQTNNRTWTLVYDSGLLTEVRDPMYPQDPSKHFWQFTYDATGRILSLADKEGDAFTYEYSSAGRLSRATDPGTLSGQFQQWRYIAYTVRPHGEEDYYQKTTYTDRRGNKWTLHFDFRDDLLKFANPLAERVLLDHQASHEVIQYTDPMNRCWDSTYDAQGNLTSVMDQYGRGEQWTYDGLNNLTSYTDGLGHTWTAHYTDPDNPTSPTAVHEPPLTPGEPTTITYFNATHTPPGGLTQGAWNGLIETVTDPMGVTTRWEYDEYGQPSLYVEGTETAPANRTSLGTTRMLYTYDAAGRFRRAVHSTPECPPVGGGLEYCDGCSCPTGQFCPLYVECKGEEPFRPAGEWTAEYDAMGALLEMNATVTYAQAVFNSRSITMEYDELGRPQYRTLTTDESGSTVARTFDLIYNDLSGVYTVSGPDGVDTVVTLDEADRPMFVEQAQMWAYYTYYPDGRIETVTRSNTTITEYAYDFENLVMNIEHYNHYGALILGLQYTFTANRLVAGITESDQLGQVAMTTFEHDARRRLTEELRTGMQAYLATYTYDDNGNRLTKEQTIGAQPTVITTYTYDLDDPAGYGTMTNRLMSSESYEDTVLLETLAYEYNVEGDVSRIMRRPADDPTVFGTRFEYDRPGRLWRAVGFQREEDVGEWHPLSYWSEDHEVALTNQPMTRDDAQALAESLGGWLAEVPSDYPWLLDWFVDAFRPTDNQEARYWLGGRNTKDYPVCEETPYNCWQWSDPGENWVFWMPSQAAECGGPWPSWCYGRCVEGGWLSGQPDDGGPDCVENGEEERMQFVFNLAGDPNTHGFADAYECELRRALIVRPVGVPELPAQRTSAREFRYDDGRQRYLSQELDPATLEPVADGDTWSDYVGDWIYADYKVDQGGAVTELVRYLPGGWQTDVQAGTTAFFHANLIGTTRMLTDNTGLAIPDASRVYTAFGDTVTPPVSPMTRYGYAGEWGYEGGPSLWGSASSDPGFLHVGARWYDPAMGRFLQRDPIGLAGALNVYGYVLNSPLSWVDPLGLLPGGAGSGFKGGFQFFEGAKALGDGALAACSDSYRQHLMNQHEGESRGYYERGCRACKKHKFARNTRRNRARCKTIYPKFNWYEFWNWGLGKHRPF